MKLYVRRQLHHDTKGLINRQTVTRFLLHARVEFSPEEKELVNTYQLGRYFIWERSDTELQVTIKEGPQLYPDAIRIERLMGQGANVVFSSFIHMLNAEDEIKKSCRGFVNLLTEAHGFEAEQVVEF